THGGQAAKRRGQSIAERKRAIREGEQEFGRGVDVTVFEGEILPMIRDVPLSQGEGNRAFASGLLADTGRGEGAAAETLAGADGGSKTIAGVVQADRLADIPLPAYSDRPNPDTPADCRAIPR